MKHETDPFRMLYDANHQRVTRLLGRIVGPQDAEDLTQAVFAKAAKALPEFRGDAQASTWLYRIAANAASDWLRGRAVHEAKVTVQVPETLDHEAGESAADAAFSEMHALAEQELVRKDIADRIRAEIGQLPEIHRDVLILRQLGGLADDEVAQTLGITAGNAKVRLHRARQELKKAIGARCDFYRIELSCAPSSPDCCPPGTLPDRIKSDHYWAPCTL
jgi:RNA polymerase sigma factor (sigma-70 family)